MKIIYGGFYYEKDNFISVRFGIGAISNSSLFHFENKLNEKVKKTCEYYGANTPEEALVIIMQKR